MKQLRLFDSAIVRELGKGKSVKEISTLFSITEREVNKVLKDYQEEVEQQKKFQALVDNKVIREIVDNYEKDLSDLYYNNQNELTNRITQNSVLLPRFNKILLDMIDDYEQEGLSLAEIKESTNVLLNLSRIYNENTKQILAIANQQYTLDKVLKYLDKGEA